jgi:signal transduction histidine kinase
MGKIMQVVRLPGGAPAVRRAGVSKGGRPSDLEALGRVVAELAHEARNPLASILANLEAWELEPGAEFDLYGPRIRREAERLARLMSDLLELSRPPRRLWKAVSIRLLVEELAGAAQLAARSLGVSVEVRIAPGASLVEGDPGDLRRALQNLVENALQHTPRGGMVRIDTRSEPEGVVIEVGDSGPGFSPEEFDLVFEPFFSRRRGGSGLGLAIVRRIVADHRGRVEVSNLAAGGALASIRLPAPEFAS